MQKHSAITLKRATQWFQSQVQPCLDRPRAPLTAEWSMSPEGPWESVAEGTTWGPAFSERWFRLSGTIPMEWDGTEVAFFAPLGGERTWWKDGAPHVGIDGEHPRIRIADEAKGGSRFEALIQAYAMGSHVRVFGDMPPRDPASEKVGKCELCQVNTALVPYAYDIDFALSLLKQLPETDPGYATLVRALNDCVNLWAEQGEDSVTRGTKILKDAYGGLTSELKHTVYPLGHAHLDTAWLWPLSITKLKMAHTTANQLANMARYPEYIYVHSQASQYEWLEKEYPKLFTRVKKAAEAGQWEPIGSMWVEADCNLTGGESLVRQFFYGRRYFQAHFGNPTKDMFLPDVFGYSAALPQILQKFGIKYFLTQKISWNQFNKFPHNTFLWQGIDGTKVWSHFPPADTYVGSCEPEEIIRSVKQHKDQARSDASMYLFGWGDGGGGPTERHIEFLRRARMAPYLPEIEKRKSAQDFYREAAARSKDLITWVGELYLEGHRGTLTSQAANKQHNRNGEFLLRDAEWLWSFASQLGKDYPANELERLWKIILLNQFHDIIPGSSIREVYEDSDQDYADMQQSGEELIRQAMTKLGSRLDRREHFRPFAIFHNSTLSSQASIPWNQETTPQSLAVGDVRYPLQDVEEFGERKLIFESPAESLGSVAVADLSDLPPTHKPPRLKTGNRKLESDQFTVRFDAHGNITSILMLDDHPQEIIEPGKLGNLFQLFDDHPMFWEAWDVDPYLFETAQDLIKSETFEIVERGPVRVAAEIVKRFGNSTIRQRISLGPTPGIRFDTWVDWREHRKMLKVGFPIAVNSGRATYEIQFGHVERPTHRNTSWDFAKFEVPAQKWVDLSEGGRGAALINTGKYGYDVEGNMLRLSLLRSPKAPDPDCDMGEHRFSYVLLPHYGLLQQSQVVAASYSVNAPVRVVPLEPGEGARGEVPRFLGISSEDLVIETVKKAEDAPLLVVRMYECHNTRGSATLTCPRGIRRAWLADLNETPDMELDVVEGGVRLDYRPFEIITLLLELD